MPLIVSPSKLKELESIKEEDEQGGDDDVGRSDKPIPDSYEMPQDESEDDDATGK